MIKNKLLGNIIVFIMGIVTLLFFTPIYFMVINTFKPLKEVILNTSKLPETWILSNYAHVWGLSDFGTLLRNSIVITAVSVIGIVVFGAMAGYRISRMKGKIGYILVLYFIMTLIIPFQAVMIPLVKIMKNMSLIDSIYGIILVYIGLGTPMGIFLYHGAVKAIPYAIEEAAIMDGAGSLTVFFKIIFPLLAPITSTLVILETLWVWNDYLLPLIVLQSDSNKTIPLGTTATFFGKYMSQWHYGITAIFMASIPMIILYSLMQKYVIKGIVGGAVK